MNLSYKILPAWILVLSMLIACTGCGNTQAVFSEQAYQQAISLKVESLELMGEATEAYTEHQQKAEDLQVKLQKAYEYAHGRPKNEISTRQWQIMINPDRNLIGGFMARWEQQGSMSPTFVNESKKIIADAFDTIIQLESGKIKPSDVE